MSSPYYHDMIQILIGLQFHFNFYISRTLPNTFALILSLWAFSLWLDRKALQVLPLTIPLVNVAYINGLHRH